MVVALAHSPPEPAPDGLATALAGFAAPAAELLRGRELLRRTDAKFLIKATQLPAVIAGLDADYAALKVPTGSIATYQSLYFDTADLVCFHDHRRGRRLRSKIRVRHYPDRALTYLEIKAKHTELVTHKHRIKLPYGSEELGPDQLAFLRGHLGATADALRPIMRINYKRIGLLGIHTAERVTIDLDLEFLGVDGARHGIGDATIVEVKQPATSRSTPVLRALARIGAREQSLSKYTTAIALTQPTVRKNRFLENLRALERICR